MKIIDVPHVSLLTYMVSIILLSSGVALAQTTNPTPAACGLPTGGEIVADVTYTLTANCTQTSTLNVASGIDTTIVGNGYSIDGSALDLVGSVLSQILNGDMTISDVTIIGGGFTSRAVIAVQNINLNITNGTFRDYYYATAISTSDTTATLTNVLFENAIGFHNTLTSYPTVLQVLNGAKVTATNIVIRDVYRGNAALHVGFFGSLTLNGCLTMQRVFPRNFHLDLTYEATLIDNNTGECTGMIGNGAQAVFFVAEPVVDACGLPLGGFVTVSRIYSLTADCVLTSPLYFPEGVYAVINANGHTISSVGDNELFLFADDLVLDGALVTGTSSRPAVGFLDDSTLTVRNSIIRNTNAFYVTGTDSVFEDVLFEGMTSHSSRSGFASVIRLRYGAHMIFRNTVIRNASGGGGAIRFYGSGVSLTVEGCFSVENVLPKLYNFSTTRVLEDHLTDNSTGPCPSMYLDNVLPILETSLAGSPSSSLSSSHSSSHWSSRRQAGVPSGRCGGREGIEAIPLGSIACIFRAHKGGDTVLSVYGVTDQSVGFHMLTVYQSQLDAAVGESIIGVSPDGRALVVMWHDRNVTIKVGPDHEGKILHLTFDQSLYGIEIGLLTTYGDAPGLPYLSKFGHASASAAADTEERPLQGCLVTTTDYVYFRRVPSGEAITVLVPGFTSWASARTTGWFNVSYDGISGWISAGYVTSQGACA